ncbi:MAG: hypothetical protein KDC07_08370 [Chitinophagaceae bacterium]|nr:hypothetical protein [Chitinophagaceae bacterium]MCB9046579.1 hypothetical protein [Chitinophagales bacterium]
MKKTILFIAAGLLTITVLPSCNKSYTCECLKTNGSKDVHTVISINRTQAQKDCNEYGLVGYCDIKE